MRERETCNKHCNKNMKCSLPQQQLNTKYTAELKLSPLQTRKMGEMIHSKLSVQVNNASDICWNRQILVWKLK
ncbi:hypothetical protein KFK09_028853 [Dendrobium nobile]|uniref:Uncharacterized protein n=1 Tax=Dendrobium nobile TaxID=94219 RepID=A0A8T3A4D5_DENNO|nr:hypothetical protein KFK09_028853 [Dendrobium nobile]